MGDGRWELGFSLLKREVTDEQEGKARECHVALGEGLGHLSGLMSNFTCTQMA